MKKVLIPVIIILTLTVAFHLAWPYLQPHWREIAAWLLQFKKYCRHHPYIGYSIYACVTCFILLFGLPISTALMLLAGVIFGFWEATTLVMACRFTVAMITFLLVRHAWLKEDASEKRRKQEGIVVRAVGEHPKWSVFLARLAPIPDSIVNYSMAAAPVRDHHYALMTLLGMIPVTLVCVGLGQYLGNISKLVDYLR